MQTNLLAYLERTVQHFPDKTAFTDTKESLSFGALHMQARRVGSFIAARYHKEGVVVLMSKRPAMIAACMGVLYGGCFYVPLAEELARRRVTHVIDSLAPRVIITDAQTKAFAESLPFSGAIFDFDTLCETDEDNALLDTTRMGVIDTDLAYVVYTSGSTGLPKGVAASHRNVIDYIEALTALLRVDSDTIFGNQTPFYVDACLKEVFSTLKTGATTVIIPKRCFVMPLNLVTFLNEYKINTICWVVSALTMVSGFGVLDKIKPLYLKTIAFGSELFHLKQFKRWREALPETRFINLYGPTETTGMCCFYEVSQMPETAAAIPIGKPFPNTDVFLVAEGRQVTEPGIEGEIFIRGSRLAAGYYRDSARTNEVFVQNPLHHDYPETVYRTGDMAAYDNDGNLRYLSRRDHQVKHMGYRIELAEIEAASAAAEGVAEVCCVHDAEQDTLRLYFTGETTEKNVAAYLRNELPKYMRPASITQLAIMPHTVNGKIDRVALRERLF